ncbi:MAG: ATP-binding protein [Gemmatimonadota bacterium]
MTNPDPSATSSDHESRGQARHAGSPAQPRPGESLKILYVDDSPFDRALVRDALEREAQGFTLVEASNREELEAILASDATFDLVLSDFNILGMTGLDVLDRVGEALPGMPVIIVTGTGSEEIAVEALKAGAADYVIKQPAHIRRLPQTIQAILETEAARRQRDRTLALLAETEDHLRQLRRLESVGRLAGGIAHDFNNLLTVILGNVEGLSHELPEDSPLLREVNEIRTAARRAASLTRQLLEFSSRDMSPMEPVDVAALVQGMQRELKASVPARVRLRLELDPGLSQVMASPSRLRQLVLTLTANAMDAVEHEGTIQILLDRWIPPAFPPGITPESPLGLPAALPSDGGPVLRLRVTDNGHGMSPDVLERVFEPFFTTKDVGQGTGLGLASAFGTVRQAGGTILAESEVGTGTTFTVLLPFPSNGE